MNTHSSRPATVWVAVGILLVLAFLSCVGGYLFNLSGADEPDDYVIGSVFVLLGGIYLTSAVRLPSGKGIWRNVALVAAAVHGVFNAVVKVGIEQETESLMFVALTAALITLLVLPRNRAYFEARRPALT
jgi:uncharacterized membrane protein YjjP (DUF1212 family)